MQTVKSFQVLLCIINNLTLVIYLHSVKWWKNSVWLRDKAQTDTTIPGHCGPGSNGNEGVLIPQNSRTGAV